MHFACYCKFTSRIAAEKRLLGQKLVRVRLNGVFLGLLECLGCPKKQSSPNRSSLKIFNFSRFSGFQTFLRIDVLRGQQQRGLVGTEIRPSMTETRLPGCPGVLGMSKKVVRSKSEKLENFRFFEIFGIFSILRTAGGARPSPSY